MFTYFMPTKIVSGRDCVLTEAKLFESLGKRALIVTGKSSAKNGALKDVTDALSECRIEYALFDRVLPNPSIDCIREGAMLAKSFRADFVVAIGGGSPMDAAKAIAMLALHGALSDEEIFQGKFLPVALPMAHVPTTAGTGSEVTQYSIITNDLAKTKTSISSPAMFPRIAFLDGKYMQFLPEKITVNTAIDAFSHAAESLLSRASSPMSALAAKEALKVLYPVMKRSDGKLSLQDRDALLLGSTLAGIAIAQSGTTAVHGLGYCLTYFCGIDHGRANGLLIGETFRLCKEKKIEELKAIEEACGERIEEIIEVIDRLLGEREKIGKEKLLDFTKRSVTNKNVKKSVYEPNEGEIERIFLRSFGE